MWFCLLLSILAVVTAFHPVYLSVTTLTHRADQRLLQAQCRIFTNDLEEVLRKSAGHTVDLLHTRNPAQLDTLVARYILRHMKVSVNGAALSWRYLGYEPDEEAVMVYLEAPAPAVPEKIEVWNDLLYEFQKQQMGILHITVNNTRKSQRLLNPDAYASFTW